MDKETYLKKTLNEMRSDYSDKLAKAREKKRKQGGVKYKVDEKQRKKAIAEFKKKLGSKLAEKINFKGHQLGVRQKNKDNKGK